MYKKKIIISLLGQASFDEFGQSDEIVVVYIIVVGTVQYAN